MYNTVHYSTIQYYSIAHDYTTIAMQHTRLTFIKEYNSCNCAGSSSNVNRNFPCDVCQNFTSGSLALEAAGVPTSLSSCSSIKVDVTTLQVAKPTSGSVNVVACAIAVSN